MEKQLNVTDLFLSHTNKILVLMIAYTLPGSSCNIINPVEPVPAYVHVDSISLSTNLLTQGSSSSKIVDSWVYVDGNIVGTFEMPVTLPVLSAGVHNLTIRPGILIDGIAATRTNYPFYSGYDSSFNFESAKIVTVMPHVTYTAATHFDQLEDFDQSGITFTKVPGSDTVIVIDANVADELEGKCGAVYLDATHDFFACASIDSFPLPLGSPVYMEMNYRGNNEFTVGVITYTSTYVYATEIVTFKSAESWRKEYINLTPFVNSTANAFGYKIYLKATKNASLATASLYFDNIKVVH